VSLCVLGYKNASEAASDRHFLRQSLFTETFADKSVLNVTFVESEKSASGKKCELYL